MNDKIGSGSAVYLKFFRTLYEVSPKIEPKDFNTRPLLFLQPEEDYIIQWTMSKPFYEALPRKKEMIILKNCGHIPLEKPGINQMIYCYFFSRKTVDYFLEKFFFSLILAALPVLSLR